MTNVLGVLFWSLFPLLWVDRVDFALESPTAVVDLAVALVVLKHCEAQGWLQCTSCRHRERRVSAPRSLLPRDGM